MKFALMQVAFETALRVTNSPLIRGYLLAAERSPFPTTSPDGPIDADGKHGAHIGTPLQVHLLRDIVDQLGRYCL